jgi:trans-aconitate 2-methyltransferase
MTTADGWSPSDYANFRDARRQPFLDVLALVRPVPQGRLLDLGCGTGALTAEAHARFNASATVGLDASAAMLAQARPAPGLTFVQAALPHQLPEGPFDLILSNSALNWVPEHRALLQALRQRLAPQGQLALQMPSNPASPFSTCCEEVAAQFERELAGYVYRSPVEAPQVYSQWLAQLGFAAQRVGTWYYPQHHASAQGLVDFAKGGLLSPYRERLTPEAFTRFELAYQQALARAYSNGPVFFAFRRVFVWAQLAGAAPAY